MQRRCSSPGFKLSGPPGDIRRWDLGHCLLHHRSTRRGYVTIDGRRAPPISGFPTSGGIPYRLSRTWARIFRRFQRFLVPRQLEPVKRPSSSLTTAQSSTLALRDEVIFHGCMRSPVSLARVDEPGKGRMLFAGNQRSSSRGAEAQADLPLLPLSAGGRGAGMRWQSRIRSRITSRTEVQTKTTLLYPHRRSSAGG